LQAENNAEKSRLFSEYIYLLIPLTFFTLQYTIPDSYNKLLYDAVFITFLSEFLERLLIFAIVFPAIVLNLKISDDINKTSEAIMKKKRLMLSK